ncbi:18868_t:CDS:2, partial [Racocetra fulgida]
TFVTNISDNNYLQEPYDFNDPINFQELYNFHVDSHDQHFQDSCNFQNPQHLQDFHCNIAQNSFDSYTELLNVPINNQRDVYNEKTNLYEADEKESHEKESHEKESLDEVAKSQDEEIFDNNVNDKL